MSRATPTTKPISVEVGGKTYDGEYYVAGRMVHVYGAGGQQSTQLGGMGEQTLARMLLRELVAGALGRGDLN